MLPSTAQFSSISNQGSNQDSDRALEVAIYISTITVRSGLRVRLNLLFHPTLRLAQQFGWQFKGYRQQSGYRLSIAKKLVLVTHAAILVSVEALRTLCSSIRHF